MECSYKCGGKCCKDFDLPISPMELEFDLKRYMGGFKYRWQEINKIAPMVIYLGYYNSPDRFSNRKTHHYTCKHLDTATGLCKEYENRPVMCRTYPYGDMCRYRGCGFKQEVKNEENGKLLPG